MQEEIILGIDPGTAILGYGVIKKRGDKLQMLVADCVRSKASTSISERLLKIAQELKIIIDQYQPTEIVVEEIFFSKNVKTAISVAQARGVVLLTAAQAKIKLTEYKPNQIKQAVCGYGQADKRQVQEMVKRILCLKEIIKPDDAADALAAAICHAHTRRIG